MGLRPKFGFVLGAGLLIGLAATLLVCARAVGHHARDEVLRDARFVLDTANAARHDTMDHLQSQPMAQTPPTLLPAPEPASAAAEAVDRVRRRHAEFRYRELAVEAARQDWERSLVDRFRQQPHLRELVTESEGAAVLVLAQPVRRAGSKREDSDAPADAQPPGELVALRMVSVPTVAATQRAGAVFRPLALELAGVFLVLFVSLERLYAWTVARPLRRLAEISTRVSLGDFSQPEFSDASADDISLLGHAFNRMRRSITLAFRLLAPEPSA